jgi:hypothetical protein
MLIIGFETKVIGQKGLSQYCVAQNISRCYSGFGRSSVLFSSSLDFAGGKRMAIRVSPSELGRLKARGSADL